ncbi:MAG TPA: hypothetical protein VF912_10000 [Anaeromyxobacter sp.]
MPSLDDLLKNPLLRRALQAGEEQVGKAVAKVLASESVATGVQTVLSGAVQARAVIERGVTQALHAANLPSKDDVTALRKKLEELEAMIDGLAERVDRDRNGNGGGE